jgi:YVTN family beta-propeller protein
MTAPHAVGAPAPKTGRGPVVKSAVAAVALAMLGWLFWPVSPVGLCAPPGRTSQGDTGAAREVTTLPVGAAPTHIVPSTDGRRVYVVDVFGVWAVDPVRNAVVGHYGGPDAWVWPRRAAVSPDGTRLYVTDHLNGTLDVLDTATMTRVGSAPVGGLSPSGVAVSAGGRYIWVGHFGAGLDTDQDNAVTILDADSLARVDIVPIGGARPDVLTIAPHDQRLYVGGVGGQTHVIDMSHRQVVAEIDYSDTEGMVLAPNGICGYLASAFYEDNDTGTKLWNFPEAGKLAVLDTRNLRWLDSLPRDKDVSRRPRPWVVTVSPNNRYLFGITSADRTDLLEVIDTATWRVVARIGVSTSVQHIAISPDGRQVYLTSVTNNALLTVDVSPYA